MIGRATALAMGLYSMVVSEFTEAGEWSVDLAL